MLHGLFVAWVATRPERERRYQVSGELVYLDVAEPKRPEPPPEVRPPEPEKRAPAPRLAPAPPGPAAPDVEPSPADDVPRAADQPVAVVREQYQPRGSLGQPSLLPGASFTLSLDAGVIAEIVTPGGLHAVERPEDLVGDLTRETLGAGRVDRGLVHPYYSQLGKALVKSWDADRVAKQGGLKSYGEQFVQNTKIWNEIWLDRAEQFGKTGAPVDAPAAGRRAPVNDRIQGLPGADLEARKEMGRVMRDQYKATRRATIRVVQDKAGRLVKVELVSPSNDGNVDREALKDVRAAAEKLPPPPEEALEGKEQLSSLWSFELIVSISPPVPTFTFEFDEALGFIDTRLPLDRRIYKKVRLVAVE